MNTAYLFTLFLILSATSFAQTTQDSLDLYNQTLVVMKYFEDHGYVKSGTSYRYESALEKLKIEENNLIALQKSLPYPFEAGIQGQPNNSN